MRQELLPGQIAIASLVSFDALNLEFHEPGSEPGDLSLDEAIDFPCGNIDFPCGNIDFVERREIWPFAKDQKTKSKLLASDVCHLFCTVHSQTSHGLLHKALKLIAESESSPKPPVIKLVVASRSAGSCPMI